MTPGSSIRRRLVTAGVSIGSTFRVAPVEAIHRLITHFEEWPEWYIEMRAALYEDLQ